MSDFFNFNRHSQLSEFQLWAMGRGNVDRIKQLKDNRHGHWLFGLFDGVEKRGMIQVHNDQPKFRQDMIEALKELHPEIKIHVRKANQ